MMVKEEENRFREVEHQVQDIVNRISLVSAIITFLTLIILRIYRPRLVNRDSLKVQRWIALVDILRHTSNFDIRHDNDKLCSVIGGFISFSDQVYVMLNVLIAMNTFSFFVLNRSPRNKNVKLMFFGWLLTAILMDLVFYRLGAFGKSKVGLCNFRREGHWLLNRIFLMYFMLMPGTLFCGLFSILLISVFKSKIKNIRVICNGQRVSLDTEEGPVRTIKVLYWKILIYPLSCFITLFPFLTAMTIYDSGSSPPKWYFILFRFCFRLPGITNLIFMLNDPHFQHAIKYLYTHHRHNHHRDTDKEVELLEFKELQLYQSVTPNHQDFLSDELKRNHAEWSIEYSDGQSEPLEDHIRFL